MNKSSRRVSRTQYIVLGILSRGPASGYDIVKAIEESTSFFWVEGFGQVYPTLKKLKKLSLITSKDDRTSSRSRIVYAITAAGRKILTEWLRQPYRPTVERNELLLKIFFGENIDPEVVLSHISRARSEAQAYCDQMSTTRELLEQKIPDPKKRFFFESTVRAGEIGSRAILDWCEETETAIRVLFKEGR